MNTDKVEQPKLQTKKEVAAFLDEIARQVVEENAPSIHMMIALNTVMRVPNAEKIFDNQLKEQARDLWLKLKSAGLELDDPPLLFEGAIPDLSAEVEDAEEEDAKDTKPAAEEQAEQ